MNRTLPFVDLDNHIPLFVPRINIAMSLGGLFQRVDSVNNGLKRSSLDQLFEGKDILCCITPCP
jgi:hypothetical protein